MKVLIVDDASFSRMSIAKALQRFDFSIVTAASAVEALKRLREMLDIGAVISELSMPGMSGIELIEKARELVRYTDDGIIPCPPFILLTSTKDKAMLEEARMAGYDHILLKPMDINQMLTVLSCAAKVERSALSPQETLLCKQLDISIDKAYKPMMANAWKNIEV